MGRKADELRAALRQGLTERLAGAGWREVTWTGGLSVAGFVRPLEGGMAVTAEVTEPVSIPDSLPVAISGIRFGVTYEPLRRWWPLLGERFALALVETSDDQVEDFLEISTPDDVPAAVEQLATLIEGAEPSMSLDALLEVVSGLQRPALLAAAGRFDEAAVALARYEPVPGTGSFAREEQRTAFQLRRWIDSRGDDALLPSAPPPSQLDGKRPSFRKTLAEGRAQRAAVSAVKAAGRGRDRDELRALLERELARRGATMSPSAVEHSLDHLWDTSADRRDARVEGLKTLGRVGIGVARAIRDHELDAPSRPEWLEPPAPAFYVLPLTDRWSRVRLDAGNEDRLERIHEAGRSRVPSIAVLVAWLQPGADGLTVLIGQDASALSLRGRTRRPWRLRVSAESLWSCTPDSLAATSNRSTCSKSRSRPRSKNSRPDGAPRKWCLSTRGSLRTTEHLASANGPFRRRRTPPHWRCPFTTANFPTTGPPVERHTEPERHTRRSGRLRSVATGTARRSCDCAGRRWRRCRCRRTSLSAVDRDARNATGRRGRQVLSRRPRDAD
ncbi:hypothetical protein DVA67_032705 [Solirubrobacter sp. CPCC 204708]|uniref:Uncharacterized protein n=1 Tax=Solirubrobacter deserti TaxID=2282478 RepID=A0ABT4RTF9_9ACTN|nr:hypothetical protein [Solirubrobacter deserti]MBE2320766.1 hypothetical protein [Solirubrobacter deserti]MDA0141867.1 hypothetical protein [Solirubrobacter deserti]